MAKHHVMLSYQWNEQELVKEVYEGLRERFGMNAWMDIYGGVKGNINDSMAQGVDGAAVVCCFMTKDYSNSKNCKKELNYTDAQSKVIVPVMCEKDFKATGWLGIITAGLLWIDFRDPTNFDNSLESLAKEIVNSLEVSESEIQLSDSEEPDEEAGDNPPVQLKKKPGRAFRHKVTGKFLAESGQVKFHPASGNRSTLVLRNKAEDTSYWVEERAPKSDIHFFQNYATHGYLGYDPNGDYIYTKGQHYGAEEWVLKADDKSTDGRRAVVLFANFGKRYLAIRDGNLTGVSSYSEDCVWILD